MHVTTTPILDDNIGQLDGYEDYSQQLTNFDLTWKPNDTQRILLLCGGLDERADSLSNLFKKYAGFEATNYDTANGPQFDIVDDTVWDTIHAESSAMEYVGCVACPPCGPMSRLHSLPGPPPLFDVKGPGRYGRSDLSPRSKERARKHILLTTRVAQLLTRFTRLRIPWIFEAPWASENEVSALNLDEFISLLAMDGVVKIRGVQCPFGGESSKPTAWVTFGVDLTSMPNSCPHQNRTWYNQRSGETVIKPHAPTKGKDVFLLHRNPLAPRDRPWPSPRPWVAEKLEVYPPLLCRFLVTAMRIAVYKNLQWAKRKLTGEEPRKDCRFKYSHGFAEKILWRDPLRGEIQATTKEEADDLAIGGLRDTAASVARLSNTAAFGRKLGMNIMDALRSQHKSCPKTSWIDATCGIIGAASDTMPAPPPDAVAAVKKLILEHIGPVDYDSTPLTKVDAHLLRQWQRAASDPDYIAADWMVHGAPMGVTEQLRDPGIFPETIVPPYMGHDDLHCDVQQFKNYPGVEDSEITETELQGHLDKQHLAAFGSPEELEDFVGGKPILNKLGLITKVRNGIKKSRMILDTKQSWVKHATWKTQRVILPRLFDAVLRLLALMALGFDDGSVPHVESFVLDFTDAFWQIPVKSAERRFYCAVGQLRGIRTYFAFLRAAQGSTNGPTLWARVIALVARLTQSLFASEEVRLMCYVDDPLAALCGPPEHRRLLAATIILVWSVLGFQLAFAKGQLDQQVTWIGGTLKCEAWGVLATVKAAIVEDICADLKRFKSLNIIPKKELHSLVGKLNHAAGLLIVMRPFLEPLWAALASDHKTSGAPANTIWRKQILQELVWFEAFFIHHPMRAERKFTIAAFLRVGTYVEIGTDASPWGMGGWLRIDGRIKEYFGCPVSSDDVKMFGVETGTSAGQQVWECLAVLIAVDLWKDTWTDARINLQIRSDNVTALTTLVKMRPSSPTIAIIARELALRLIEFSFPPDAMHTPGIAHVLADELSRIYAPGGTGDISAYRHRALIDAKLATPPARPSTWYRAYRD